MGVHVLHPVHLLELARQVPVHDLHLLLQPGEGIGGGRGDRGKEGGGDEEEEGKKGR